MHHASNAHSTVVVRNIEEASAHETSVRAALLPMGKIKEVALMQLEGDRQSWALVTYAGELSAKRATSRTQRKAYGCTVALPWKVSMVPAVEMLQLRLQFMPASLDADGGRVQLIREAFDRGVSPMTLYRWRGSPESLAKAHFDETESRLLEIKAVNAGKTVKQLLAPSESELALKAARRQQQLERRKKVLGYQAQVDESTGARHWGGQALNRLVKDIGRTETVLKAWAVPPVTSELDAEYERLNETANSLRELSKLPPTRKPEPPPPRPNAPRRVVIQLSNTVQAPTWPRSTCMGSINPRIAFDVPNRNPYATAEIEPAAKRQELLTKWKDSSQSVIVGWRRDGDSIVVSDPAIVQLLLLCGVSKSGAIGFPKGAVELRVTPSMLTDRTVFQKLLLYAADHPRLKLLLSSLHEIQHQVGPWLTKLRDKTAEITTSCPDGRPCLRAARVGRSDDERASESETQPEKAEPGLGHELPELNVQVAELLEKGEADTALLVIDSWLERHHEAGGHPPEKLPSTAPEVQLLAHRSKALIGIGEFARSNYVAMKILKIRPSNPRPHISLASAHIDRAEQGQYFRATECLLDATGINPAAVRRQSLQQHYAGVRQDRHYRNEVHRRRYDFPTQDFIRSAMDTVYNMHPNDDPAKQHQVRKKYDWTRVDVSDLVLQQHRVRIGMLKMADDVDGVTPTETNDLIRSMTAEQLPKQMINTVRAMCEDGEIDEHDKEVLEDLAPPDKFENLSSLVDLLEVMEQKILAVFRHYCYLISAGHSGVNERSDAVSSAQFTVFVKDCNMLDGPHALPKSVVDQIFLRSMFLRGGADGMGDKSEVAAGNQAARKDFLQKRKKEKEADALSRTASLGQKSAGSSTTLGSDGTQRALELYEFTGAMVRLANRRYPNMIGKGLAAKFDRFVDEVLDKMEAGGIHNLEELMASKEIKTVLKAYDTKLTRVFEVYAKEDTGAGSVLSSKISKNVRSAAAHTVNLKEFEQFAEDAGLVQASMKTAKLHAVEEASTSQQRTTRSDAKEFPLSRQNLHEVFVEVNLDDDLYDDDDDENEADEIVYDEFNECLVLLSQLQLVKKAAKVVLPPPKTFKPREVAVELTNLLQGALSSLASKRKELRGIDRVRKDDGSSDDRNDIEEDAGLIRLAYEQAEGTQGRRAGGITWTKLPWKRRPSVPLHPPSAVAVQRIGGTVTPGAARPITRRDLMLHTVPALEKLARSNNAILDAVVDEVMKDPSAQKERLVDLLSKAAATGFRKAYVTKYGVPPPADLDQERTGNNAASTSTKNEARSIHK